MNTKQFKALIKEAVRETIKEELAEILKEAILGNSKVKEQLNESTSFSFTSNDVVNKKTPNPTLRNKMNEIYGITPQQQIVKQLQPDSNPVTNPNPLLNFIAQTAAEITPQDRAAMRNYD